MKKLILAALILFLGLSSFSQKIYFAYVQSENGQPFYVRLDEKVHNSSSAGYVILSRLLDSTYTVYIGFAGQNKEEKFTIPIKHKDKGYLLKSFEEGWGLYDMHSMKIQMSQNATSKVKSIPDENVSPFTEILSKAADDPSLKEKRVPEPVKSDPIIAAVKKEETIVPVVKTEDRPEEKIVSIEKTDSKPVETSVTEVKTATTPEEKKETVKVTSEPMKESSEKPHEEKPVAKEVMSSEPLVSKKEDEKVVSEKKSEIVRYQEKENAEGHDVVFIDKQEGGKSDTIRVMIPAGKPVVQTEKKEEPKDEKKFLDIPVSPANDQPSKTSETVSAPKDTETKASAPVSHVNTVPEKTEKSDAKVVACTATADESDFIRLRRKMVAADDDDAMVNEARKGFKEKCFTVYQIRNLGSLFLSDEGKYKLFDAAYAFVSDAHNFISLKLELKEGYWVKRFEAMLR